MSITKLKSRQTVYQTVYTVANATNNQTTKQPNNQTTKWLFGGISKTIHHRRAEHGFFTAFLLNN